MFANPFMPIFGGKPGFFFGRAELVERFERGLAVRGSEDRALFITGTRGTGKRLSSSIFLNAHRQRDGTRSMSPQTMP